MDVLSRELHAYYKILGRFLLNFFSLFLCQVFIAVRDLGIQLLLLLLFVLYLEA